MVKEQPRDRFNWWLLVFGAVGALIGTSVLVVYIPDIGQIFYFFIVAPSFSLILIVFAIWKRRSKARGSILLMLVPFWVVTVGVLWHAYTVRASIRWLLHSKAYKAGVLGRTQPLSGQLKHIAWDGWGGFGVGDTVVYLVFDPNDSLSAAARSDMPAKVGGIPCEFASAYRLESHWYSIEFYTGADWEHCTK